MTAAPSEALIHSPYRQQPDPKRKQVGPVAIAPYPNHSTDVMSAIGKTATRSKSGCMTCRIRRKKCDLERINDSCRTCIRLKIECLGWGAKRPEALRDPKVVKEIQNRIKMHLASNNMIKGSARSSAASAPASHPSSAEPSGAEAGGMGGSYANHSFLSFDDLKQEGFGATESSRSARGVGSSSRKGKSRQQKSGRSADADVDPEDLDGSGEDDYEDAGGTSTGRAMEPPSSFERNPPSYPPPPPAMYDGYRPRYPYQMGSPPQPGPYQPPHATHPYPPSNLRTGSSYEYADDRKNGIENRLREFERERELERFPSGMVGPPPQPLPMGPGRAGYDLPIYPAFPSSHFIYAPGVGAASAGRNHGHASYQGPSPNDPLRNPFGSNFPPPPVRLPPINGQQALPSLSMTRSTSGGPQDMYSQSPDGGTANPTYGDGASVYQSPSQYTGPSPASVGGITSAGLARTGAEGEGEGDVDGEPLPQMNGRGLGSGNNTTLVPVNSAPSFNAYLPNGSSFGDSYSFDRKFVDADAELAGSLVPTTIAPESSGSANLVLDNASLTEIMNMVASSAEGLNNLLMAPGLPQQDQISPVAAEAVYSMAYSPAQSVPAAPLYIAQYGSLQMQFSSRQMELLSLWRNQLCNLQYHIAHITDSTIADMLYDLAMSSQSALFGTLTLTSLYKFRLKGFEGVSPDDLDEVKGFKERVANALMEKRNRPNAVDEGDAMAGLHMVSAVLFEGGTDAQWDVYLNIAKTWVQNHPVVRTNSWNTSPSLSDAGSSSAASSSALIPAGTVDKKSAFIIKTTAWFDVIGAITMRRAPFFLSTYRELFGRQGGAGMERIMGCNERVLLAIAETAALADWRAKEEARGCLSIFELATRARAIEENLRFVGPQYDGSTFRDVRSQIVTVDEMNELLGLGDSGIKDSKEAKAHDIRLVSNVFRATGKLYLHTVLSKCNPDVPEIKGAVSETVKAFRDLAASTVDRSLVFPIALAGCMTDDLSYREYLSGRLRNLGKDGEMVGNSKSCLQLMEAVWRKRDAPNGPRVVDWIDTMKDMGWSLLLV